ncbi:MAG: gamma-glutamyl phosphate reductase [Myxococcaceae bacterium]|nr:gamma-glutamyl phosphate reductase [Myxococcaceae bacterium]
MKVEFVVPERGEVELAPLLERLRAANTLPPFDPVLVEFVDALSRSLSTGRELRAYPEIIALGYWARKANVLGYQRELAALASERVCLLPRGFVFHIPPANVDTIFMYSWLLSLLVGNVNLIRLSSRESPQVELVCQKLGQLLDEPRFARVRASVAIVRYGHESGVSEEISRHIDLRVVWGGDATVAALQAVPLHPAARQLSFGDKFSFSALHAERYLETAPAEQKQLALKFFNDALWFDQAGCSSPRLVVWCGDPEAAARASGTFFAELEQVIEAREHRVEVGHSLAKLLFTYQAALDGRIRSQARLSSELTVLELPDLSHFDRSHPGAGLFFVAQVRALHELSTFVTRRDQTLSTFGFTRQELADLVTRLGGRGLDRIVPFGQALTFNRFWDGYDLLQELTRRVYLEP